MHIIHKIAVVASSAILFACNPPPPDVTDVEPVSIDYNCDHTYLKEIPDNPGEKGPWEVGARTVNLGPNNIKTEIWYPAFPGSEKFFAQKSYDLKQFLPDEAGVLIPDGLLSQNCDCLASPPIDFVRGPYPVIVMVHGTGAFRTASLSFATHWASRGFVVVSADNPNITLKDAFADPFGIALANQAQDTIDLIDELQETEFPLLFLRHNIDVTRIGLAGHSAGGNAVSQLGDIPGVRTIIPMAASNPIPPGDYLNSSMIMGANLDGIVPYFAQQASFNATPAPARFVGLENGGHLAFTELCVLGEAAGGLVNLVGQFGIEVPDLFIPLVSDGCGPGFTSPRDGFDLIEYASTAAFEETLQCNANAGNAFDVIEDNFPQLESYLEKPPM